MESAIVVMTNLPDAESAQRLAEMLVTKRFAACVNIMSPCRSIYRWKGTIESATEVPLLIKTRVSLYANVEQTIRSQHPYDVPEIIALPIDSGSDAYLSWVIQETEAVTGHNL